MNPLPVKLILLYFTLKILTKYNIDCITQFLSEVGLFIWRQRIIFDVFLCYLCDFGLYSTNKIDNVLCLCIYRIVRSDLTFSVLNLRIRKTTLRLWIWKKTLIVLWLCQPLVAPSSRYCVFSLLPLHLLLSSHLHLSLD